MVCHTYTDTLKKVGIVEKVLSVRAGSIPWLKDSGTSSVYGASKIFDAAGIWN
jgi:hypothetical protein